MLNVLVLIAKYRKYILPTALALIVGFGIWRYNSLTSENRRLAAENTALHSEVELRRKGIEDNAKIKKEVRNLSDDAFIKRRSRWLR